MVGAKVNGIVLVSELVVGEKVNDMELVGENVNGTVVSSESSLESSVGSASSMSSASPFRTSSSYMEVSLKGNSIHPGRGSPAASQVAIGL